MDYAILLKKVEGHTTNCFEENDDPQLTYHNLGHTRSVVKAITKIANHYEVDERSKFILTTAAWFHDVGYLFDKKTHEVKSAELAGQFLKMEGVDDDDILEIKKCIMATIMPQVPLTLFEKMICDADLFYLGTDKYKKISKQFLKERETFFPTNPTDSQWLAESIRFLEVHKYHTSYCRLLLDKKKAGHIELLQKKQQALSGNILIKGDKEENEDGINEKKSGKNKKDKRPTRGIETMFRISASNSVRVSVMADNKAHIMISVNSIIISVVLALVIRNMEEYIHFLIPTILLVTVNIATIIYAVLATRPKISDGRFTEKEVDEKSVNLLFFGSFYKMNYPEYHVAVNKMMKDSAFLYGNLTKDVFWQGKVLGRKYQLLRIAYNIFMYGIILSVLSFFVAAFFHG